MTMGNVLIIGRSTHESLPGPLEGRTLIVLTRDPAYASQVHEPELNVYSASSMAEALELAKSFKTEWIFLAGGAKVYEEGMDLVNTVFLTLVHKDPHLKYDVVVKNLNFDLNKWSRMDERHVFEPDSLDQWYNKLSHTYYTFERIEK
jgi:dihydrofolate reductase